MKTLVYQWPTQEAKPEEINDISAQAIPQRMHREFVGFEVVGMLRALGATTAPIVFYEEKTRELVGADCKNRAFRK
jgi:hypothetical protein